MLTQPILQTPRISSPLLYSPIFGRRSGVSPSLILDFHNQLYYEAGKQKTLSEIGFNNLSTSVGKTYIDSDGVLKYASAGELRIDYGYKRIGMILNEDTNTNRISNSNNHSGYSRVYCAIANETVLNSPDGTANSYKITAASSVSPGYYLLPSATYTAGEVQTTSIFLKAGTQRYAQLTFTSLGFAGDTPFMNVDLNSGEYYLSATGNGEKCEILFLGNGWYRVALSATIGASANATVGAIAFADGLYATRIKAYTKVGTEYFYAFGGQNNIGDLKSYIPTEASSISYDADKISLENINWIKTGVTIIQDLKSYDIGYTKYSVMLHDNVSSNIVFRQVVGGFNGYRAQVYDGNVGQAITNSVDDVGQQNLNRLCIATTENDYIFSINGNTQGTDTNCSFPSNLSYLNMGSYYSYSNRLTSGISYLAIYPERKTDEEVSSMSIMDGLLLDYENNIYKDVRSTKAFEDINNLIRNSEKTQINENGTVEYVSAHDPCYTWGEGRKGILIENESTNLLNYSSSFTGYSNSSITTGESSILSPDGVEYWQYMNDGVDGSAKEHSIIFDNFSLTVGNTYSISLFVKANPDKTEKYIAFRGAGIGGVGAYPVFDLSTGEFINNPATQSPLWIGKKVENISDGVYRVTVTGTVYSNSSFRVQMIDSLSSNDYQGDGTGGILLWLAQIEQKNDSTSPIPTSGSQKVRPADILYVDTLKLSYENGFTVNADFTINKELGTYDNMAYRLTNYASDSYLTCFYNHSALQHRTKIVKTNVQQAIINDSISSVGDNMKVSVRVDTNNANVAYNGTAGAGDFSVSYDNPLIAYIGAFANATGNKALSVTFYKFEILPVPKSDADLEILSS